AWVYLVVCTVLSAFAMLAVVTLTFLCSVAFRSSMVATAVSAGAMVVGFVFKTMATAMHLTWIRWLFVEYLSLQANWTGMVSRSLNMNIPLWYGVVVLAAWGVGAYVVSVILFNRRDVLNA
ncbi:MAG: hypothetical protein K6T83_22215, partial [Alicyclobacillus sp.]|nr:hypothetical protein [Alicyclobacillus sp.]